VRLQRLLLAAIALAILMMAFIGIAAYTDGDPLPHLTLFLSGSAPILTAIAVLIKDQKVERTLEVSEQTDQKVDQLLNGSMQDKIARVERDISLLQGTAARNSQRIGNMETIQIEALTELRRIGTLLDESSPLPGAD
jgi:hypothetical protein